MSDPRPATAVIRSEPDAYDIGRTKLMGRQSAGHGFLRAAVQARGQDPIYGLTPQAGSARAVEAIVREIDAAAAFEWVQSPRSPRMSDVGVFYLGDSTLATQARVRQPIGVAAYALCGVTHTTASHGVMDEMVGMLRDPLAPWDALVCTSTSVIETVRRVHEAEADYARWRYGVAVTPAPPQLPLIPLGVHCDDFRFEADRDAARSALGLEPDVVVGLFVGRLVFHAKAHPFPMFRAMQAAAERTGKRVALIFSGWAPNDTVQGAFRAGAEQLAPDVRVMFLDGREKTARLHAWAAADLFLSPSDNIQETFGLTPVEAMAAGLPVVVSDYDGYRDTVRDGVDGLRVPTWAPAQGMGAVLARAYEDGTFNYDQYCWAAAASTAVDVPAYADAVCALVENPDLRRRMGEAGRTRARAEYDWAVVFAKYRALWGELDARRRAALADPAERAWIGAAPSALAGRLDPFRVFGHYPTHGLNGETRLTLAPGVTNQDLVAALAHPLFASLSIPSHAIERLFSATAKDGGARLSALAVAGRNELPLAVRAAGLLLKMGLAIAQNPRE